MTKRDIAGYLNVDIKTLYNWKKNKPNLYKTVMLGLSIDDFIKKSQANLDEILQIKDEIETEK